MFGRKKKSTDKPEIAIEEPPIMVSPQPQGFEQGSSEAENLMRLLVSRLSLAAEGRDLGIDQAARSLREIIRGPLNYARIQEQVERISSRLRILDEQPVSSPVADGRLGFLESLFDQLPWPPAVAENINSLRQQIREQNLDAEEVNNLLRDLLRRSLNIAISSVGGGGERSMNEAMISPEILNDFLRRLDPDWIDSAKVGDIRACFEAPLSQDGLRRGFADLADFTHAHIELLRQQRDDLEHFLGILSECLSEVENHLKQVSATRVAAHREAQALEENMRDQVKGLSDSLHETQDLEGLKHTVQERIDHLLQWVGIYCAQEGERNQDLECYVRELTTRISQLEKESGELRTLLSVEHAAATTDVLTGIPNRATYDVRIKEDFKRWQMSGKVGSLIVFDIDHFKRINDVYGHQTGDKALNQLARLLQSQVRDDDFLARYGGEEFVLILSGAELQKAVQVADKLRMAVALAPFNYQGKRVPLTISVGVSAHAAADQSPMEIFERADRPN